MAGLFALGVMSLSWMALIAALIALEKTLPWERVAMWGTAAVLLALAIALLALPDSVPGLVIPGDAHGVMHAMGGAQAAQVAVRLAPVVQAGDRLLAHVAALGEETARSLRPASWGIVVSSRSMP